MNNIILGKSVRDISNVEVSISFSDRSGVIIPLTRYQAAYLVRMLGIYVDGENGTVTHLTDDQLKDILERK